MKAVLFDLDGTLIDSVDLIAQSARHAFTVCGEPVPSDSEWLADLGMPLKAMFEKTPAMLSDRVSKAGPPESPEQVRICVPSW